jgi:hypothetical protein
MAAPPRYPAADPRRQIGSPRPKGRGAFSHSPPTSPPTSSIGTDCRLPENKETLCRNVLIYGHCRYEDQGCTFSHEQNKGNASQDGYVTFLFYDRPMTASVSYGIPPLQWQSTTWRIFELDAHIAAQSSLDFAAYGPNSFRPSVLGVVIQTWRACTRWPKPTCISYPSPVALRPSGLRGCVSSNRQSAVGPCGSTILKPLASVFRVVFLFPASTRTLGSPLLCRHAC